MTILLIDDDLATQQLVTMTLEHHGHSVQVAGSAADALAYLRDGNIPDAILLDLYLPDGDGFTTLAAIRQVAPDVKVIATTAYHTDTTEDEIAARGFDGYQPKPLRPAPLMQYLSSLME